MRACRITAFVLVFFAAGAAAQAPTPVAERVITRFDTATRVTLFSNHTVVVTIREKGEQGFMRQITLSDEQYMVYLGALESNANELGQKPVSSVVDSSQAEVELSLHVGKETPRLLRFSPLAIVSLPLSRILAALDDLESQVLAASPSAQELESWQPQRGDRVQLLNGTYARVAEVMDDGVLILEHEESYLREVVPPGIRDRVILHVVDPEQ
jgi:hypothetical protein